MMRVPYVFVIFCVCCFLFNGPELTAWSKIAKFHKKIETKLPLYSCNARRFKSNFSSYKNVPATKILGC